MSEAVPPAEETWSMACSAAREQRQRLFLLRSPQTERLQVQFGDRGSSGFHKIPNCLSARSSFLYSYEANVRMIEVIYVLLACWRTVPEARCTFMCSYKLDDECRKIVLVFYTCSSTNRSWCQIQPFVQLQEPMFKYIYFRGFRSSVPDLNQDSNACPIFLWKLSII